VAQVASRIAAAGLYDTAALRVPASQADNVASVIAQRLWLDGGATLATFKQKGDEVMTRTGKIARLPLGIREVLNKRMADGEPAVHLMHWLNGLPEVRQVLLEYFGGRDVKEQNVSEWKQGGFVDWQAQQETAGLRPDRAEEAKELKVATEGAMAEHLGTVLRRGMRSCSPVGTGRWMRSSGRSCGVCSRCAITSR